MSYKKRLQYAALISMTLHLLTLLASALVMPHGAGTAPLPADSMVVRLRPPKEKPAPQPLNMDRRLIDAVTPSNTPPPPTDLIAETNTKAMDAMLRDGELLGPNTALLDDFDAVARVTEPSPAPPASLASPPKPPEVEAPPEKPADKPEEKKAGKKPEVEKPAPAKRASTEPIEPTNGDEKSPAADAPQEAPNDRPQAEDRLQFAKATPAGLQDETPARARSRVQNAIKDKGFTNFPALEDEIAPYLKEIRNRVERQWKHMLLTKYSGTSPTKAVIDCAISADGKLVTVTIAGAPGDRIYAALCKEAVEKAGPFAPFPFEVPDLYRNRNLEISWTFGFL